MKYTLQKGKRGKWGVMSPDGKVIDVFISEQSATHHAQKLNEGIAPLHAEIARLQAENAKLVTGIKSLIEAQNRGIAANEPFNDAFYKGRVDSMWHTVKALETILAESEADNA